MISISFIVFQSFLVQYTLLSFKIKTIFFYNYKNLCIFICGLEKQKALILKFQSKGGGIPSEKNMRILYRDILWKACRLCAMRGLGVLFVVSWGVHNVFTVVFFRFFWKMFAAHRIITDGFVVIQYWVGSFLKMVFPSRICNSCSFCNGSGRNNHFEHQIPSTYDIRWYQHET